MADRTADLDTASRFVGPTKSRLLVKRGGHSLLRSAGIPKPVVLVDTREREPWALYANHGNWISGERRSTLKTGDYSVEGMESLLALEPMDLKAWRVWISFHKANCLQ